MVKLLEAIYQLICFSNTILVLLIEMANKGNGSGDHTAAYEN